MDKNNRVLIGAVLLIFVTLLSFNLTSLTGSSTKEGKVPSVSVSPNVAEAGDRLTVSVISGELGVNEKACIYDGNSRVACTSTVCNNNVQKENRHFKCLSSVNQIQFNIATSTSLESGVYSVCVWDYDLAQKKLRSGDYSQRRGHICGDFTLMNTREYYE